MDRLKAANGFAALAGVGCAGLLTAALGFQFLGGLAPCPMCVWQRWPHVAGVALAGAFWLLGWRTLAGLGALAMLGNAGLGLFHVGVEQRWWEGPATCVSGSVQGLSTDELMAQILNAPVVRCDEIAWSWLGVSMAGWNALASLGLAGLFALAVYASSSASQYR
jgi:disulfide bond formation protein DsbB